MIICRMGIVLDPQEREHRELFVTTPKILFSMFRVLDKCPSVPTPHPIIREICRKTVIGYSTVGQAPRPWAL